MCLSLVVVRPSGLGRRTVWPWRIHQDSVDDGKLCWLQLVVFCWRFLPRCYSTVRRRDPYVAKKERIGRPIGNTIVLAPLSPMRKVDHKPRTRRPHIGLDSWEQGCGGCVVLGKGDGGYGQYMLGPYSSVGPGVASSWKDRKVRTAL